MAVVVLRSAIHDKADVFLGNIRGYAAGLAGQGNIYNNDIDSAFELALVQKNGKDVKKLGSLEADGPGKYRLTPGVDSYLYANSADHTNKYSAAAANFTKNRIWVESDGSVIGFVNGSTDYRIGIRPKEGTAAHPGDDLRLTFGIRKRGAGEVISYTVKLTDGSEKPIKAETSMREADYVATYDKKLLWRANLYIDDGAADWNNLHRWNDPANNEWFVSKANGADVDGGQIDIKPWSKWNGGSVSGHVAYGWGCWDGVPDFNAELEGQKNLILDLRTNSGAGDTNYSQAYANLNWVGNPTTAPAGDWNNYVFPARLCINNSYYRYRTLTAQELATNGNDQHSYYVNGSTRSIPGLSTKWHKNNIHPYEFEQTTVTSGIDCSGLAHMAAKYEGSLYWVAAANEKYGSGTFLNGGNAIYALHEAGWLIDSNKPSEIAQRDIDRAILSCAVPGDLLVIDGHVIIVQNLRYPEGSSVITAYSQVDIIHATQGTPDEPNNWRVQLNTWDEIGSKTNYVLRRYK